MIVNFRNYKISRDVYNLVRISILIIIKKSNWLIGWEKSMYSKEKKKAHIHNWKIGVPTGSNYPWNWYTCLIIESLDYKIIKNICLANYAT
jgi:hypothetical protein